MNELKHEITARIANMQQQVLQTEADKQTTRQRQAAFEQLCAEEAARIANLGMEFVQLLQEHGVKPRPLWKSEVIGRHVVQRETHRGVYNTEKDIRDYVSVGHGWKVYQYGVDGYEGHHSHTVIGIDDTGRPFDITGHASANWRYDAEQQSTRAGLLITNYIGASTGHTRLFESTGLNLAEAELTSDNFRNGIAAIIGGMGLHHVSGTRA